MRIIVPTGYMGTGSSAITDLIAEYENVINDYQTYEFVFLHCPDGLFDLEDKLIHNNNILRSDEALRTFQVQMKKLYDKKYWWIGNYKKVIGPEFMKYTNNFINSLEDFHFNGYWYTHEEVNTKMFIKLLLRKPIKIISRNKLCNNHILKYKDGLHFSYPDKKIFYDKAKEYINNIINKLNPQNKDIILDQLLLPYNITRVNNYFDDNLRMIVVDRDPRDLFILNKYIWDSKNANVPYPKDAKKFCDFYQRIRNIVKIENSKQVLQIQFEDLIYSYENTINKIENFMGYKSEKHINKYKRFNPKYSIKNTQLFRDNKYEKEIKIIEKELKNYLYEYPYLLNNDIHNSVEVEQIGYNYEED